MCRTRLLADPGEEPHSAAVAVLQQEAPEADATCLLLSAPLPLRRSLSAPELLDEAAISAAESAAVIAPSRTAWWITGLRRQQRSIAAARNAPGVAVVSAPSSVGGGVWATVGEMVLWLIFSHPQVSNRCTDRCLIAG